LAEYSQDAWLQCDHLPAVLTQSSLKIAAGYQASHKSA
jgi:hypothetical protein